MINKRIGSFKESQEIKSTLELKKIALEQLFNANYATASDYFSRILIVENNIDIEIYNSICNYYLNNHDQAFNVLKNYFTDIDRFMGLKEKISNQFLVKSSFLYYINLSLILKNKMPEYCDDLNSLIPKYYNSGVIKKLLNETLLSFNKDLLRVYCEKLLKMDIDDYKKSLCLLADKNNQIDFHTVKNLDYSIYPENIKNLIIQNNQLLDLNSLVNEDFIYILAKIYKQLGMANQFVYACEKLLETKNPEYLDLYLSAGDFCYDQMYVDKAIVFYNFCLNYCTKNMRKEIEINIKKLKECLKMGIYVEI